MNPFKLIISTYDILTSSGRYKERLNFEECDAEARANAEELSKRVSALYWDFFLRCVSSGFRTTQSNKDASGAKRSNHLKAAAIDVFHVGYWLKKDWLQNKENSLLVKHDLYMEDPAYTTEWHHFQLFPPKSGRRVFIP